jgi:hypothetical protein
MMENYIQYAGGYQKDDIDENDNKKAIADIQQMDDEHGAFWVAVTADDENVIEVNRDLSLTAIFDGTETKYKADNWKEVEELYNLLLAGEFDLIRMKIK